LFGKKDEEAAPPASDADDGLSFGKDFITIPSHDFYGFSSRSPNGRYAIAWLDGGPDQSRRGRWLFLDGEKVVAQGKMARPNDGKIADNGVFILNDCGAIETLSGTLKAFGPDGKSIFSRKFKANLFNNGLSPDGRWAVCQTCNSDDDDAGKLFLFDLGQGAELCSWAPESGWPTVTPSLPMAKRSRSLMRKTALIATTLRASFSTARFGSVQGCKRATSILCADCWTKLANAHRQNSSGSYCRPS
jgi:hypothetical protein